MSNDDVVKMNTDIQLMDVNGSPIIVNTQQPECLTEMFSWDGITRDGNQSPKIFTGEK